MFRLWKPTSGLIDSCGMNYILPLYNILYTVSTQQQKYSNIMYAIGYTVATCFDRKRSSSGQ